MSQPPDDEWQVPPGEPSPQTYDELLGLHEEERSLADEVLEPKPPVPQFRPRRRRRRSPVAKIVAMLVAVAVVIGGGVWAFNNIGSMLPEFSFGSSDQAPKDYEGNGTGEVMVEVPPDAAGGHIAEILVEADVIASASAFVGALQADPRSMSIQPGTYRMASQMSAKAALDRMLDGSYRQSNGVTIREGLWVDEVFALLAEATDHEIADYEAVDSADLDLPDAAEGDLEGFLFPSTYEFAEDSTPQQQLQAMVDLFKRQAATLDIPEDELREIVIKASLIQAEGAFSDDLPKIARVIENRLEADDLLRFDSTVHFIFQERGLAGTTNAQRDSDDPHNTYKFAGLPPGPINSPGEAAMRAAMNPTPGEWYYFVAVNPVTGQTNFAVTWEEHEENVALFRQWCADNPDQC